MSNSKESTLKTQFSLSIDSELFSDSALISGIEDESFYINQIAYQNRMHELLSEIELINEDRSRLRIENEKLKVSLQEIDKKNAQIELLQNIASKALAENYKYKQKLNKLNSQNCNSPIRNSPRKINIRSPSEKSIKQNAPLQELNCSITTRDRGFEGSSTNASPLKSQRNISARTKVTRNSLKYPKLSNASKTPS